MKNYYSSVLIIIIIFILMLILCHTSTSISSSCQMSQHHLLVACNILHTIVMACTSLSLAGSYKLSLFIFLFIFFFFLFFIFVVQSLHLFMLIVEVIMHHLGSSILDKHLFSCQPALSHLLKVLQMQKMLLILNLLIAIDTFFLIRTCFICLFIPIFTAQDHLFLILLRSLFLLHRNSCNWGIVKD